MIRVRTGSRLHFGLFALPSAQSGPWLNSAGEATLPRRNFGGVGLMIENPGIELTIEKAAQFSTEGLLADRARSVATAYRNSLGIKDAFRIQIVSATPEHMGLGTGTQLGLAVARAIAELTNQTQKNIAFIASLIGRGKRSAIGIHGFEQGGFLVEGGKSAEKNISPLVGRYYFPPDWRILLIFPRDLPGPSGPRETEAFADIKRQQGWDRTTEAMSRIVLLGMIPALLEHELETFGEALYDFNRRAGEAFQGVQGGVYADPSIERTVRVVREVGVKGVGQSSWGPVVFAIVTSGQAAEVTEWLTKKKGFRRTQIMLTSACNQGAVMFNE